MYDPEYSGRLDPRAAKIAKAISIATYPPFMGILAFAAIALFVCDADEAWPTFGIGILTATVAPLFIALSFSKMSKNDEDEFGDIKESRGRIAPMAFIEISYISGAAILWYIGSPDAAYLSMLAYFFSTLAAIIISTKWKISLHAMGVVGPATALAVSIWPWGALTFLILPFVCWSRYVQRRHTLLQLIAGSIIGTLITYIVFLAFRVPMEMEICGKRVVVYTGLDPEAPMVVLNSYEGDGSGVLEALRGICDRDLCLVSVSGLDWDSDMSPWKAGPAFRGGGSFAGNADAYLEQLVSEIIPAVISGAGIRPRRSIIAGYSMAGLFAVYSVFRTDAFDDVVSASGSLWFPDIIEFITRNKPVRVPDSIYFSLGDMESKTDNITLAQVGVNTALACDWFLSMGSRAFFEKNPGNHFRDPELRMAKGIAWSLEHQREDHFHIPRAQYGLNLVRTRIDNGEAGVAVGVGAVEYHKAVAAVEHDVAGLRPDTAVGALQIEVQVADLLETPVVAHADGDVPGCQGGPQAAGGLRVGEIGDQGAMLGGDREPPLGRRRIWRRRRRGWRRRRGRNGFGFIIPMRCQNGDGYSCDCHHDYRGQCYQPHIRHRGSDGFRP